MRADASSKSVAGNQAQPEVRTGLVLGMLCFVYVLNFLDRQLISILAKPIQDELNITDSQLASSPASTSRCSTASLPFR